MSCLHNVIQSKYTGGETAHAVSQDNPGRRDTLTAHPIRRLSIAVCPLLRQTSDIDRADFANL
jgi:hypothetical protein